MVICFANRKGGVGKTTIALHLCFLLSQTHKTLLVDADSQASGIRWISRRNDNCPFTCISLPFALLYREIPKMKKFYDAVVIDCPPSLCEITRSAMLVSDLCVIPIQPSPLDIESAISTVESVKEVKKLNLSLKEKILINRKNNSSSLSKECRDLLLKYKLPVFTTEISQRTALIRCAVKGMTIFELEPDGKSALELKSLVKEILEDSYGKKG